MLATLPWDLAHDLPWRVFTHPATKWATQPSFVVGEYLFIALALAALFHAWRSGPRRTCSPGSPPSSPAPPTT
jgi:hypothetical protein